MEIKKAKVQGFCFGVAITLKKAEEAIDAREHVTTLGHVVHNPQMVESLEQRGMRFSGMSPDAILPEIVEYDDHPWFIGVQFHPELKSRPFAPHPLFSSFIGAAVEQSRLV